MAEQVALRARSVRVLQYIGTDGTAEVVVDVVRQEEQRSVSHLHRILERVLDVLSKLTAPYDCSLSLLTMSDGKWSSLLEARS